MIDYSKGYTSSFRACFVDPITWSDMEWFDLVSGSVNRTTDSLRNSASLTVRSYNELSDRWVRIYMDADQNGGKDREALFTGLASSPGASYHDGVYDVNIDCYSVLKPMEDILLPRGYYVMAGENGVRKILELFRSSNYSANIPISYQDGALDDKNAILEYSIVAEGDETNLSMIEKILDVIHWRMQVYGDGTIYLSNWNDAKNDGPIAIFSSYTNNVIETSFSVKRDLFNCPNVFEAIYGDFTAIARDDDENSPLSTINRGREIWKVEDASSLEETESLGEYALRRLKEEQSVAREINYNRRYVPDVYPDDIIMIDYDQLQGVFYVDSQSITLGHAAVTSEQVSEVI